MSDHAPMTPEQAAAELASDFPTRTPEYILERAIRAMATIAAMAEEVEYRIVDPDTNGGEYELRRWSRHVTEWSTDNE